MISVSIFSPVISLKSLTVHFVRQKLGHRVKWLTQDHSCMHAKSLRPCPTLYKTKDCGPPGSSVHGILQARVLEWAAILFSRGPSWPRHGTCLSFASCVGRQVLYNSESCISSWLAGIGSGGNKSSTSGLGLPAACVCFKGLHWKHMCYVPAAPAPPPPILFPFLSFSFIPSGRRNETRCYKTRGEIPGKSCLQLILYILLAQFLSLFFPLWISIAFIRTLNGPDQQCSQKAVGAGRPPLGCHVRTGIDSVSVESRFIFCEAWKSLSLLGFTQSQVPSFRCSGTPLGARNLASRPTPVPSSPPPNTHFLYSSCSCLGSAWALQPLPQTPLPQVKINKMSVNWWLFGLHLTSFFLFWVFWFLCGNYKPCLDSGVGVISSFQALVPLFPLLPPFLAWLSYLSNWGFSPAKVSIFSKISKCLEGRMELSFL